MNQVETTIYKLLSNRQRVNTKTDIVQFTRSVRQNEPSISEQDVLAVFKQMQDQGYGTLVNRRGKNPTRFYWTYNLKDVAQKVLGNTSIQLVALDKSLPASRQKVTVKPSVAIQKRRARKLKAKPSKAAATSLHAAMLPPIVISLQLSADTSPKDLQALIELANSLKQK